MGEPDLFLFFVLLVKYSHHPKIFTVPDADANEMYRTFIMLRYWHPTVNSDTKLRATYLLIYLLHGAESFLRS